jgi:hypothetical protein
MHSGNRINRALGQIASALVLVCVLSAAANAYTVIMRGGRRLEIPSSFMVTTSTLTYEVSPGVQVSLNLAAIDIVATEKANSELPGSLLRRAEIAPGQSLPSAAANAPAQSAKRTITNQDLEASVRRRRESELAYEHRRKELGLPSVEESRRQAAAESDLIAGELAQARASERESENYWRVRATALRTEMEVLDEQQQEIRRQLDGSTFATSDGSILAGLGIVSLRSRECFGPCPTAGAKATEYFRGSPSWAADYRQGVVWRRFDAWSGTCESVGVPSFAPIRFAGDWRVERVCLWFRSSAVWTF